MADKKDQKYLSELVIKDAVLHFSPKKGKILFVNCRESCLYDWNFDDVQEVIIAGKQIDVCVLEGLTIASIDEVKHHVSDELKWYVRSFDAILYCIPAEEILNESTQQLRDRFSDLADDYCIFSILIYDPSDQLSGVNLFTKLNFNTASHTWFFRTLDHWNPLYVLPSFNHTLDALTIEFRNQVRNEWRKERSDYRDKWHFVDKAVFKINNMYMCDDEESKDRHSCLVDAIGRWDFDLNHSPTPSPPSDYH